MNVLFWSGGKDAWLALHFFRKTNDDELLLLTTFNEDSGRVPFQNIPIEEIVAQAKRLELSLIPVPLPEECPNDEYLKRVGFSLNHLEDVQYLVFGDWHLQDIRNWREESFGKLGYQCLFPVWKKPEEELISTLETAPVQVTIASVAENAQKFITPGDVYDRDFAAGLPEHIDPLGENGEFHTKIIFR